MIHKAYLRPVVLASCWLCPMLSLRAQDKSPETAKLTEAQRTEQIQANSIDRSYKLHNSPEHSEQNNLLTAIRNILDARVKIFLDSDQGVIVVHAPEDIQQQVAKLIATLDQPHPRYRLTYTFTELDGTRKVGVQHYSMVVLDGQRTQMKEGIRIPIYVGSATAAERTQASYTYIDAGMNFVVTLNEVQGGGVLNSKVEQSSIAPDSTSATNPNPILRQTTLEGATSLLMNKPLLIGSLDVPATTHHFDIEVVMEPVN